MNKKKVALDVGLNIISSILPTFSLQLIILPLIASVMSEDSYGLMLTITGIINLFSSVVGSSLNNTRLIHNNQYQEKKLIGDFNGLLIWGSLICFIATIIASLSFSEYHQPLSILFAAFATVLSSLALYNSVAFRIELNYFRILINSIIQTIGYGIGLGLFYIYGKWELIYLCGYLSSFSYILFKSRLWKEPLQYTLLFKQTLHYVIIIALANLLGNVLVYIDRFLLYPLLGGAAVSVYYVSSVFGKAISMAITPMTGVMLSYMSKMKKIDKKYIIYTLLGTSSIAALGYIICIVICPSLLRFLYPDMAKRAMQFFPINTLTAIVSVVSAVLNPIIIKFRNISWQIIINIFNLLAYVSISLPLLKIFGLIGFCYGALIASFLKLFMMIFITFKCS